MRGTVDPKNLLFDPEIERSARRNRKRAEQRKRAAAARQNQNMAENNAPPPPPPNPEDELMESILAPLFTRPNSSIVRPEIQADRFDIQPALIGLVEKTQFGGEEDEDPHDFIDRFLRICDTTKHNRVSDDAIRLRLFPFAVKGKALRWLDRQAPDSITTWDDLAAKFFAHFFSMEKYNRLVNEITNFTQYDGETLCAAWNRFRELIRKCPQYDLSNGKKVRIFFNGMHPDSRMVVNTAAGGSIRMKTAGQTLEIIDMLARNENESLSTQPKRSVPLVGGSDTMAAEQRAMSQQIANLNAKIDRMQVSSVQASDVVCEYCDAPNN